jgi:hypothetical protein
MANYECSITNGPSADKLFTELRLPAQRSKPLPFDVEIAGDANSVTRKRTLELWLTSIEAEDGSGESWNLGGTINGKRVWMYFSTKSRKGTLRFVGN